ncbi:MAG: dehydrogenase [Gemmatales bacterium]|nr:MAG: dehydrogenase [Gemmatales bacterium]
MSSTRRDFLKKAAGTTLAALAANVHAAGSDEIRVGIIGCGNRGTGAVDNCLSAAENVKLIAMGDAFEDRLQRSYGILEKKHAKRMDVPKDRQFVGLDAYKKVLECDINYVILATPPGFRPLHLRAAVDAGKHIFTEKPVAVDCAGIRIVFDAYKDSLKKGLGIAAGTQRRHQTSYIETMKRIHDGAIGKITAARCYWNSRGVWPPKPRQASWGDLEYQMRNWYYYCWLCGDHIVEQHVHNLDVINWALQSHPIRAVGMGGRQTRVGKEFGEIFDHFAVDYEYPGGIHVLSMCRHAPNCENNVSEAVVGSKGNCHFATRKGHVIDGETTFLFPRQKDNLPYVQEHTDLIRSIRAGKPINELKNVAESTLTAIIGRMSAYTGKAVTWDFALEKSKLDLMPPKLDWNMKLTVQPVPIPGKTPLI